jgi:hypothetical protein
MKKFIVWAEADSWNGIVSDNYIVEAETEEDAVDLAIKAGIEEGVSEFFDEEDYLEGTSSISVYTAEYNPKFHLPVEEYAPIV